MRFPRASAVIVALSTFVAMAMVATLVSQLAPLDRAGAVLLDGPITTTGQTAEDVPISATEDEVANTAPQDSPAPQSPQAQQGPQTTDNGTTVVAPAPAEPVTPEPTTPEPATSPAPGNSGSAPGQSGSPGNSGNAPGQGKP